MRHWLMILSVILIADLSAQDTTSVVIIKPGQTFHNARTITYFAVPRWRIENANVTAEKLKLSEADNKRLRVQNFLLKTALGVGAAAAVYVSIKKD